MEYFKELLDAVCGRNITALITNNGNPDFCISAKLYGHSWEKGGENSIILYLDTGDDGLIRFSNIRDIKEITSDEGTYHELYYSGGVAWFVFVSQEQDSMI